jgi:hypothetical protein
MSVNIDKIGPNGKNLFSIPALSNYYYNFYQNIVLAKLSIEKGRRQ